MNNKEIGIIKDLKQCKALDTLKYDELVELERLSRNKANILNLLLSVYVLGYERGTKKKQ